MQLAMKASPAPRRSASVACCNRSKQKSSISLGAAKAGDMLNVARPVTAIISSTRPSFTVCSSERNQTALSSRNAIMSSGANRHHSPVEAYQRLLGNPLGAHPNGRFRREAFSQLGRRSSLGLRAPTYSGWLCWLMSFLQVSSTNGRTSPLSLTGEKRRDSESSSFTRRPLSRSCNPLTFRPVACNLEMTRSQFALRADSSLCSQVALSSSADLSQDASMFCQSISTPSTDGD
jgi:hypothetical protein